MLFNATQIRERLLDWSQTNQLNNIFGDNKRLCRNFFHRLDGGLTKLPYDREFLYQYDLVFITAFDVMAKRYFKSLDAERMRTDADYSAYQVERISFLKKLLYADMKRVSYPVAVTAWLTIDNWRWPEEDFNGLSYGLVLQYPELLILGAYITGIGDRDMLKRELSPQELEYLDQVARAAFSERREIENTSVVHSNEKEQQQYTKQNQESKESNSFNNLFTYPPQEDLDSLDP